MLYSKSPSRSLTRNSYTTFLSIFFFCSIFWFIEGSWNSSWLLILLLGSVTAFLRFRISQLLFFCSFIGLWLSKLKAPTRKVPVPTSSIAYWFYCNILVRSRSRSTRELWVMCTLMTLNLESPTLKLMETEPRLLHLRPPIPVARLTAGPRLDDTFLTRLARTNRAVMDEKAMWEQTQTYSSSQPGLACLR